MLPGIDIVISKILSAEAKKSATELTHKTTSRRRDVIPIPEKGRSGDAIQTELKALKEKDTKYQSLFALVYTGVTDEARFKHLLDAKDLFDRDTTTDHKHDAIVRFAFNLYSHTNALNPTAFPSLVKVHTHISMLAHVCLIFVLMS